MTETGVVRALWHVPRRLRVLRDDLLTLKSDPLPPSLWVRWLPHGLLCLVGFGVAFGAVAQFVDNGGVGPQLALLLGLAQGGAVVLALRRPVPAWLLTTAAMVVSAVEVRRHLLAGGAHDFPWPWAAAGIIGQMAVLLLLALRVPTRVTVEALGVTAFLTYVVQGLLGANRYQPTGLLSIILFTVVAVLGTALRGRREARAELVEQTTLTAEERGRRTLLEERSRIARELHDVVAHHMSVISIQAQVAPHLVENPSDELKENLDGIRQNALEALTELRRVLGVLRSEQLGVPKAPDGTGAEGDTAPHAPQPTLDRLDALVENTRTAGLAVSLEVTGDRRSLSPGAELSAYRIVQEALSNVLRHAPGASVRVMVEYHTFGLSMMVVNSRPTRPAPPSSGAGHGLLGMRERAAMLGGGLWAGPEPDGGYQVSAFLPAQVPTDGLDHVFPAPAPASDPDPAAPATHPKDSPA
ncbi:sensor histidine kinase [Streptomyces griseus]|uniref:sensor histidine kinase n=1 Tax=Streptomyces griseus TaxID=1911 RepID=UPI000690FBCB|nr:sensor histidine kinase [Streptomyces griseus]